jgi:hypothetical protein
MGQRPNLQDVQISGEMVVHGGGAEMVVQMVVPGT